MPRKKKTVTKKAPARRGRPPKVKAAEPATPARRGRPAKAKAAATPTAADQQMSVQVLTETEKHVEVIHKPLFHERE